MATLMIVEDESFERNALKNSIDWELIGVKVIGEAANGAQGLNLAMELKPDIILTDVSMPVMNAIEMTERIRKPRFYLSAPTMILNMPDRGSS